MNKPRPLWPTPEARDLLATFATQPPPTRHTNGALIYTANLTDRRVAELRDMHRAAFAEARAACLRGELTQDEVFEVRAMDEQRAIAEAIAGKLEMAA